MGMMDHTTARGQAVFTNDGPSGAAEADGRIPWASDGTLLCERTRSSDT